MATYHFVTEWLLNAPVERVWQEITDPRSYPSWAANFRRVAVRGPEPRIGLGTVADCEGSGQLPYTLRFTIEIVTLEPPNLLEFRATGDIEGGGKWLLDLREGQTAVINSWDVATTNPLLNALARLPFVRAALEKSHHAVMARACEGLRRRVEV